jgi:threonine dehydratase
LIPLEWLQEADVRIAPHIRRTPLTHDKERALYIKWENHQVTGSFKARGALNKVLSLQPWERQAGIVTASAGNHGQGVALAGKLTAASVTVFASESAPQVKLQSMRELGAEVRLVPGGYAQAEAKGLSYAQEKEATWVSAYNDGQVIAGQGTLGLEILRQLPSEMVSVWLVPVSGGGLIAGVGVALSGCTPRPRLVGVQAEASPFMHALFYEDTQENVVDLPSLADGLTGAVESGSVTIPLVKRLVDEIVLVSEEEIVRAIAFAWEIYGERVEGSGAVGLAAVLSGKIEQRPTVIVISGGNIQPELHTELLERYRV